jgi:hemerythrin-like domain-containing protein
MTSVFDVLGRDHDEVRQMLSQLEEGPSAATGADDDQLRSRKKLAEQLVIEESRHEAVEQMFFWPTVRETVPGGDRLADRAAAQEQQGEEVLGKLDKSDPSDPEFEQLLGEFIAAGREHIAFEETQVWPELRTVLDPEEAERLGDRCETAKQSAPTRPHPGKLSSSEALQSTGPVVAAADRVRDKITGRGKD